MFVGITGIARIIERTCEIMREHKTDDPRKYGAIDLETIQRHVNFHYSVTLDLFGAEISTNAANSFTQSLKGRFHEAKLEDDHRLVDSAYPVLHYQNKEFKMVEVPALNALNERLRDNYVDDVLTGIARWNRIVKAYGIDFEFKLPHRAFNRRIGMFAGMHVTPEGRIVSEEEWARRQNEWLPTADDKDYLAAIMSQPLYEPGKFANWIAPPARGINHQPIDFQYVRFH